MKRTLYIFAAILLGINSYSQGCSDAGFCTIADLDNGFEKSEKETSIQESFIFGLGEQQSLLFSLQMDFNHKTEKNAYQARLPFHYITGNLGSVYGLGDLTLSWTRNWYQSENASFSSVIGGKLPSNNADIMYEGKPLPMVYQTSLGTYDIIIGFSYNIEKWHFAVAYQHPFNSNENTFYHDRLPLYGENFTDNAMKYQESAGLLRADDIMLRVERKFKSEKAAYSVSVLPIYHLTNDILEGIPTFGSSYVVEESSGLTLNINLKSVRKLKNDNKLYYQLAFPVMARKNRPDGLTRSAAISVGYMLYL